MPETEILKVFAGKSIYYSLRDPLGILFQTGMAVDADGSPNAYHPNDTGLDYLANAGKPGNWWGIAVDSGGIPYIQKSYHQSPGYYVSTTSLINPQFPSNNPDRYLNSERIPYIVLPVRDSFGCSNGDLGLVYNTKNGDNMYVIVGDRGPDIGEASIATAKALNINADPKRGGVTTGVVYLVWPKSGTGWQPVDKWFSQADALMKRWGGLTRLKTIISETWKV